MDSTSVDTTLTATPYPSIDKKVGGTISMTGNNHVFDDGASFSSNVTYSIEVTNNASYYGVGHETIFNPQIIDELVDIDTKLETFCGVTDGMSRVSNVSNGGAISGTTIAWNNGDLVDMAPGATQVVTYQVDYAGCPGDITRTYDNTATLSADNVSDMSDPESVVIGLDLTPTGNFAKGDRVFGEKEVTAGADDNKEVIQLHEDIFSYIIRAANGGAVRIDDVVSVDALPSEVTLIGASAPVGTIYYSDDATQPVISVDSHIGGTGTIDTTGGWSTTPTATSKWIAWYVPCINSAFFPSDECSYAGETGPSLIDMEIQVQLNAPTDTCAVYDVENNVTYDVYSASNSVTNANANIDTTGTTTSTPIISASETEATHVEPPIGSLSVDSTIVGPDDIQIGETGTYILTVKNTGQDTTENVSVTIPLPELSINGTNSVTSFVSASGGTVDVSSLPSEVTIDLGSLPVGSETEIELIIRIPQGALDGETFTLTGLVTGSDDNLCQEINTTLEKQTKVSGIPDIKSIKTRDEAVIRGGEDVHYTINFFNTGKVSTTGTYIVDYIPENTVFKQAYTTGTDATATTFRYGAWETSQDKRLLQRTPLHLLRQSAN